MISTYADACDKCRRRNPVRFHVEPEEAFRTVVLNRWRHICPSCFDEEAERARVRYAFVDVDAMPWSDRPGTTAWAIDAQVTARRSTHAPRTRDRNATLSYDGLSTSRWFATKCL